MAGRGRAAAATAAAAGEEAKFAPPPAIIARGADGLCMSIRPGGLTAGFPTGRGRLEGGGAGGGRAGRAGIGDRGAGGGEEATGCFSCRPPHYFQVGRKM